MNFTYLWGQISKMERNIMPRSNRQISPNGVNHCIMRGINKQDIFLDTQDKKKFKSEIIKTKQRVKLEIRLHIAQKQTGGFYEY